MSSLTATTTTISAAATSSSLSSSIISHAATATAATTVTTNHHKHQQQRLVHKWGGRIVMGVVSVWFITMLLLHATLSRLEEMQQWGIHPDNTNNNVLYTGGQFLLYSPDLAFLRRIGGGGGLNHSLSILDSGIKKEIEEAAAARVDPPSLPREAAQTPLQEQHQQQQQLASAELTRRRVTALLTRHPAAAVDRKEQQRQQLAPPKWPAAYNKKMIRKRGGTITTTITTTKSAARALFEETHDPNDLERIRRVVATWRVPMPPSKLVYSLKNNNNNNDNNATTNSKQDDDDNYDIYNCPKTGPPTRDYPYTWPMRTILSHWNPDETDIPTAKAAVNGDGGGGIHASLCVFDWNKDYDAIVAYRQAEVPFIVQNHDDLLRTSERWMSGQTHLLQNDHHRDDHDNNNNNNGEAESSSNYLAQLLGTERQRNEYSHTNHFMFWRLPKKKQKHVVNDDKDKSDIYKDWQPPTDNVKLNYLEWYERAMALDNETAKLSSLSLINDRDHWYFRLNGMYGQVNDYLYDELPMFQPDQDRAGRNSIFIVEPDKARGINCRFGMKGVIAETHYDPTRNWIVLLGGQRRYILAHPRECPHLHLYPIHHPSGRHSMVDWSNITHDATILKDARGTEVVLQAADALYLPTSWFHFIVSLNINYQCNARSGSTYENNHFITDCGFPVEEGV